MRKILRFLTELSKNNNREWFAANKERYNDVKARVEQITEALIQAVAQFDSSAASLRPADCTYRIYRDTRFSADKTPYKTHIGIFVNPPRGKKSFRLGHYLHLEPGNCFYAAGTIGHPPALLRSIRQDIFDNIEEYLGIVESEEFRAVFSEIGMTPLKTAPKGFPKDWEYIDYLKPRNFCCSAMLDIDFITSPDLITRLIPLIGQGHRFNQFINYTVDESSFS